MQLSYGRRPDFFPARLSSAVALLVLASCSRTGFGYRDVAVDDCWPSCEETWHSVGDSDFGSWIERVEGSSWGGGISASPGDSDYPSLALDAAGNAVVAWQDSLGAGSYRIYVKRFNGTSWVELGTGSASGDGISATYGSQPSLALDSMGNPVVAWESGVTGSAEIYVKRFNGTSWVEVGSGSASGGGVSGTAESSLTPALAVQSDGNAVVAWAESSPLGLEIYVKRFDGAAWVELGAGSASGGGISNSPNVANAPSLAVDSSDRAVVAWAERISTLESQIYLKRFDGVSWEEAGAGSASAGGVSNTAGRSETPSLALDDSDRPIIAWQDDTEGTDIYVKRFDGVNWAEVGTGSASGGGISAAPVTTTSPALTVDAQGDPIVAWRSGTSPSSIYLKRYDGTSWVQVGAGSASGTGVSVSNTWSDSLNPVVAAEASGRIVVAWGDRSSTMAVAGGGRGEIYVRRFSSAGWDDVGESVGAGGGVSSDADASMDPRLAMANDGRPVVVWTDAVTLSGAQEIFGRRFNGTAWQDVGTGSASGGGVSNSAGWSRYPRVVLTAAGNPIVAWQDHTAGQQIYVAAFDGVSWGELGAGSASGTGMSNTGDWSSTPSIALDSADRPVVAWYEHSNDPVDQYEIFVRRFDGMSWVELGSGSASGGGITNNATWSTQPQVAVDPAGDIYVAWNDGPVAASEIYVRRFDGTSWHDVGSGSSAGGGVSNTAAAGSLALISEGMSTLLLAWSDSSTGHSDIYVRRFGGTTWAELPSGSASGAGISGTHGAGCPAVALNGSARPVVAWSHSDEGGIGNNEVYAKYFDGAAWREIGAGSASGGGVSNSAARKSCPSLAVNAGRACITWDEGGPVSRDVVVRCALLP